MHHTFFTDYKNNLNFIQNKKTECFKCIYALFLVFMYKCEYPVY